eukprot:Gregarina_sp_Pseudo_9__276@NODE_1177_length_1812_cov_68_236323_g1103_i0_p1_GENE_NODE_1177_length_1812_cov_68_236323_g1103_i0NODE_1177_length_1812_cov_68_236323_g1103_i0_p1_ORF_typecomplete_len556_score97_03Kelch_3/PF13415_6/3_4e03Kelch_3/PF13415_6/2e08Kelch_3/PF13415_6/4_2e08Kelch_3/PF13415_6/7_3e06Kelch_3/PF13415_6/1_1e04Kelch_3/PF13415_6/8_3e05Kelch_3/PF13415_6/0_045Kelch_4/PF13418_6/0_00046Kelch_4/PF13418_6/7_8e11Kelch_4/PF13418_6/1_1e06Kelch_4/PF13418_6/1_3e07Kelch_4/PF13418_6/0_034Kelch_4/P
MSTGGHHVDGSHGELLSCMGNTALLTELPLVGDQYTPRWGLAAASLEDKIYLFGGYIWYHGAERFHDDFYEIDPQALTIKRILPTGPSPCHRFGHSLVADPANHSLLLFGGRSSTTCFNDLWSYSLTDHAWVHLSGPVFEPGGAAPPYLHGDAIVPAARSWHTADFHKGSMYVVGGWSHFGDVFGEVWRFDTASVSWECLCSAPQRPSPKQPLSRTTDSQSATGAPTSPASPAETAPRKSSDPAPGVSARHSSLTEIFTLEGRTCHQSVVWRGALFVFGGVVNDGFVAGDELWRFDLYTREWAYVPTYGMGPGKRVSPAATLSGDCWILHGGLTSYPGIGAVPVSDVFHFDFVTTTWYRKTEVCLIPSTPNASDIKHHDRFKVARYGHCGVTSLYGPMFFGGADAYASAQSNLSWRIEILPSTSQVEKLFERKSYEEEERRKFLRDIGRFQEELRLQSTRISMQDKEIAYWRNRFEETAMTLDMMTDRIQTVERLHTQLTSAIEQFEPLILAVRGFAASLVNLPSMRPSALDGRPLDNGWKPTKTDRSNKDDCDR